MYSSRIVVHLYAVHFFLLFLLFAKHHGYTINVNRLYSSEIELATADCPATDLVKCE